MLPQKHELYQSLATCIALLPTFIMGINEAWTSVYIPQLLKGTPIKVTEDEGSWIAVFLGVGGVIGSILSPLASKLGRKNSLLLSTIPFLVSSFMLAYGNSVIVYYFARLIVGMAIGIIWPISPLYIGEIANPKIRGALGTYVYILNTGGVMFINIVGSYLDVMTTCYINIGLTVTFVLTFIWMPESPYYLIKVKKFEEAKKSLEKFRSKDEVDEEFKRIKEAVREQMENSEKFLDIVRLPSNRKAFFILFIILNGKQFTGDIPVDAYAQTIFQETGDIISPTIMSVCYYITKLIAVVVSGLIIDRVGRKPLYLIALFLTGSTLVCLGAYFYVKLYTPYPIDTAFMVGGIILFLAFGTFYCLQASIPVIILSELFPINVKPYASISFGIHFFVTMLVETKFFQATSDAFGMDIPFFTFGGICILHCVLVYAFAFETKGKTLEEIQETLKQK